MKRPSQDDGKGELGTPVTHFEVADGLRPRPGAEPEPVQSFAERA